MNQEQEDEKVRSDLLAHISNAQRADIVRAMYEFIEVTKEKWAEHVPESAAAEDTELGRARQRIAELEGILARLNPTNLADLIWILDRAAELFEINGDTTWALRARQYQKAFEQSTK